MRRQTSDRHILFFADLHIHSALSPCAENKMTPDNVLKKIISLGIDAFSITDHNSGFNCTAFDAAAKERDILFIPGIELQSSEEIHLLGYFPDIQTLNMFCSTIVKPALMQGMRNDPARFGHQLKIHASGKVAGEEEGMLSMPLNLSIDELVDRIHDFSGVAVAAHIDKGFSVISQLGYIPPQLRIDAVEIQDIKKIDEIRLKFFKDRWLNIISSSDAHYLDMMKPPKMRLRLKSVDVKSCLDCIKGDGAGRIMISAKAVKNSQRAGEPSLGAKACEARDWKELYKRT
ncbi:MAG: PHP domain-containing protein [Euryarchaeota archaeon]|nr:PHP domain-containing protein [Euryarchaeota archaeon]